MILYIVLGFFFACLFLVLIYSFLLLCLSYNSIFLHSLSVSNLIFFNLAHHPPGKFWYLQHVMLFSLWGSFFKPLLEWLKNTFSQNTTFRQSLFIGIYYKLSSLRFKEILFSSNKQNTIFNDMLDRLTSFLRPYMQSWNIEWNTLICKNNLS